MLLLYEVVPFLFSLCCKTDELNKQIGFFFFWQAEKSGKCTFDYFKNNY